MWLDKKDKIAVDIQNQIKILKTNYTITQKYNRLTADSMYDDIKQNHYILSILKEAKHNPQKRDLLRNKLYNILKNDYEIMKKNGVLQYHFLFEDNISFLRMHQKDKYGDYLGDVRYSHKYVNETHKSIHGFEQGRIIHGFRNVYPIFADDGEYLGSVEVSFSPILLQKNLTEVNKIDSHFIVNKELYNVHKWDRTKLFGKYIQSLEHSDYLFTATNETEDSYKAQHKILASSMLQDEIKEGVKSDRSFVVYKYLDDVVETIAFLPIKNIKDKKTVAYIVSYQYSENIKNIIDSFYRFIITTFIAISIILFFIFRQIDKQQSIERKNKLLQDLIDTNNNIMIVTDLKRVRFSNTEFLHSLNISSVEEFNQKYSCVFEIFVNCDGCLYTNNISSSLDYIEYINTTSEKDRVVGVIYRDNILKLYQINISKTASNGYYLITLSDVTQIKEETKKALYHATHDNLTGIYNRAKFYETLDYELKLKNRTDNPMCIAMLDIDHFKKFNDTHGHLIGDEILILLANRMTNFFRDSDIVARWGGEEFIILLNNTNIDEAYKTLNKLRESIESIHHDIAGSVTASIGVSEYTDSDTKDSIIKRCDDALYKAKQSGRNMVCRG
jgi:diguanylate cyclase (GGDEF)-like protein